jgi:PAS domain S-box-containing protein
MRAMPGGIGDSSTLAFERGQRELLEHIARGSTLPSVLDQIVRLIERQAEEMVCSILLLDREHGVLRHGAAPNLPPQFVRSIDGCAIGPHAGSCGAAAHTGQRVVIEDIAAHADWADYRQFALPFGLRACWSSPIFAATGDVVGTFAMYYRQPRGPSEREITWVERATHLASIAITRHQNMQALRESEVRMRQRSDELRVIFENAAIGMALIDAQGHPLRVNAALQHMLGYTEQEIRGMTFAQFTHPEDAHLDADLYEELLSGARSSYHVEKRYVTRSGAPIWGRLTASYVRNTDGTPLFGIGVLEDITEHKRALEQIKEQAALIDRAKDAILVRDLDGTIRFWNQGAERLYGWSSAEAVGRNSRELINTDPGAFDRANARVRQSGEWTGELSQLDKTGKRIAIEASWTLLRDAGGNPKSVLAINTDLTEQKRLEAQVARAQRIESLGTLAGGIAHDFNNILAAVSANVLLALDDLAADHPAREALLEIGKASTRATELVRQILTFSHHQQPQRKPIRLETVVGEALDLLRATIPSDITLDVRIDPNVPQIFADPTQIHQVVMNLCANALHAMEHSGGVLGVHSEGAHVTAPLATGTSELQSGEYARLTISDTGAGMDEVTLERIFDPFFTTKAPGRGTGLGLAVVHGVVKGHGGGMFVRSAPGRGTAFSVYLPATHVSTSSDAPPARERPAHGAGRHIFVVDDEQAIVRVLTQLLQRIGYESSGEVDPVRALAAFKADPQRFDAVILDLSMPRLSGPDLARELLRVRPDLPIVMTSGRIGPEDERSLRALGVREVLMKPSSLGELSAALERHLQKPSAT